MFALAAVVLPLAGLDAWSLRLPASLEAGLLFAAAIVCAVALSAALVVLLDLVVVTTLTERGANILMMPLVTVLSGSLLPLALFPDWMQLALALQPFAGLLDIPISIYVGHLTGGEALAALGRQLAWALALALAGRWGLGRAMTRLQVQGG